MGLSAQDPSPHRADHFASDPGTLVSIGPLFICFRKVNLVEYVVVDTNLDTMAGCRPETLMHGFAYRGASSPYSWATLDAALVAAPASTVSLSRSVGNPKNGSHYRELAQEMRA